MFPPVGEVVNATIVFQSVVDNKSAESVEGSRIMQWNYDTLYYVAE